REELLEVELQATTTRCKELRHNLQETKSLIPTTEASVMVGDGLSDGNNNRHDENPVGRRRRTAAAAPATPADTPHRRPPRPGLANAEDPGEDVEDEEEEEHEGE
ncbi:unnamed protein product, partial [Laminaria digitata]